VFDSYWEGGDFVPYELEQFEEEQRRGDRSDTGPYVILSPIELRPEPFQERLLELNRRVATSGSPSQPSRGGNRYREDRDGRARLRPAPTSGSAGRACYSSPTGRRSSTRASPTFRYALRDASFGEKWVGGSRPTRFDHVFASIQSLNANSLAKPTGRPLRRRHRRRVPPRRPRPPTSACSTIWGPVELLGLTATTGTERRSAHPALVR